MKSGEIWSLYGTTDLEKDQIIQIITIMNEEVIFQRINISQPAVNFRSVRCPRKNIEHVFKNTGITISVCPEEEFWEIWNNNFKQIKKKKTKNKQVEDLNEEFYF